jgi:serine protease Do
VPEWRPVEDIRVGQWAVALGLGFGAGDCSVTVGMVSALNRMLGNAIQTDAKLSPGCYGGPLCDIEGRVMGLCVPMAQRPGELAGIEMYDSGVGFAVPKHRVDEIVSELMSGTSFFRGWLGIHVNRQANDAVVIDKVADPSPMRAAGVRGGDTILAAEGKPLKHFGHLVQSLYMLPAGEDVYLHMKRKDREYCITVTLARSTELGELPEEEEPFDPSNPFPDLGPKPAKKKFELPK